MIRRWSGTARAASLPRPPIGNRYAVSDTTSVSYTHLLVGDLDIMIAFVILEQNIIFWIVLFNQAAFQHQGFELAVGHNVVKVVDIFHHLADLFVVFGSGAEIAAHPVGEDLSLAHIDHLAGAVLHQVNARGGGQDVYKRQENPSVFKMEAAFSATRVTWAKACSV